MTLWPDGTNALRAASVVELDTRNTKVIYARDYGVQADNATDDATALNAAITAAAAGVSGGQGNTVLLPAGVIKVGSQIQVKNKVGLLGCGRRSTSIRTIAGTFPINTAVVRLGDGTGFAFDCRLDHLQVVSDDIVGSRCVYSSEVQEGSGCSHVLLSGFRDYGLYFDGLGTGGVADVSCDNMEIYASGLGAVGGLLYYRVGGSNSLRQITSIGPSSAYAGRGVQIISAVVNLYEIHAESWADGIECGSNTGGLIIGASGHATVTNVVHLDSSTNAWTTQGVDRNGSTNSILDDYNGKTIAAQAFEQYCQNGARIIGNSYIRSATGDPNGVYGGNAGDLYLRDGGGYGRSRYIKEVTGGVNDWTPDTPPSVVLTYSASMTPNAGARPWQKITVTNGTAMTINSPTNPVDGASLTFDIFNNSGGAMGAITWNAVFKLAGAFTNPATGKHRTISFYYDGTSWFETNRAAADI